MSLYEARFTWPDIDADSVIVTGTFDDWSCSVSLKKHMSEFSATVSLPYDTRVLYKYVVDGKWTLRDDEPCEHDCSSGIVNNVLVTPSKYAVHLWEPSTATPSDALHLPPEDILQEMTAYLTTAFSHYSQRRAVESTERGELGHEPILGLYCPLEGGDYIVDATIKEAAKRVNAEVLSLDLIRFAASGEAGLGIRLSGLDDDYEDEDWDDLEDDVDPEDEQDEDEATDRVGQSAEGSDSTEPVKTPKSSALRKFLDDIVNMPSSSRPRSGLGASPTEVVKPRLVYVRDPSVLSPSYRRWFSMLVSAVRRRRSNGFALDDPASTDASLNPTVILFGSTAGIHQLFVLPFPTGAVHCDDEDTADGKARLRDRLKSCMKDGSEDCSVDPVTGRIKEGSEAHLRFLLDTWMDSFEEGPNAGSSSTKRVPILTVIPESRVEHLERRARVQRRREINTVGVRMAIQSVGGVLVDSPLDRIIEPDEVDSSSEQESIEENEVESPSEVTRMEEHEMWIEWGERIERHEDLHAIATRAIASAIPCDAQTEDQPDDGPTPVTWDAILEAWASERNAQLVRQTWAKKELRTEDLDRETDEIVEKVKKSKLDQHEKRLLPCIVDRHAISTTFNDVHLPASTIDSLRTLVSLSILYPEIFSRGILKQHVMTGALLFGPPGTGKTLAARALAKDSGARMLMIKPSDVLDMWVGESEKLVRSIFSLARRLSPCIVFIDEIDAFFSRRQSGCNDQWRRDIATEFMQELDGLVTKEKGVVVIGATNRPFDLDEAFVRRLPRRLLVDLPGERDREEILKILLRDENVASQSIIQWVAKRTESYSGSDLKNLCVSVALDAVKEHIELPWTTKKVSGGPLPTPDSSEPSEAGEQETHGTTTATSNSYTLHLRHFQKCLNEIKPSTSKSQVASLRSWDRDFGEGGATVVHPGESHRSWM